MARVLRGSGRGRMAARRRTSWELGPGDCVETSVIGTGTVFIGMALTPTIDGLTLARLRGRFSMFLTAASAAGDGFCGAFGIGLATAAAVSAGIGSVPTPITEQAWDGWLFWEPIQLFAGDKTAGDVNWLPAVSQFVVDTKAMRKLVVEDALYAVLEVEVEEGTATAEVRFDSRTLMMLP